MSVLPVRKISIVAQKKESDLLMKALQEAGVIHILPIAKEQCEDLSKDGLAEVAEKLSELSAVIAFLNRFTELRAKPPKRIKDELLLSTVLTVKNQYEECDDAIRKYKKALEIFSPFGEWTNNADSLKEAGYFLSLAQLTDEELLIHKNSYEFSHVVNRIGTTNYVALFSKENKEIPGVSFAPPSQSMPAMRAALEKSQLLLDEVVKVASAWSYQLRTLENLKENYEHKNACLIELKKAEAYGDLIGLSGYVLQKDMDILKTALQPLAVGLIVEEPKKDSDSPPVKLKNPKALKGFEAIVRTFTGIDYFEKDKTIIVSLLFMFLGSLCLLDAGYGFLLLAMGYVIAIKKNRDFGEVFMWTGAFSVVMGILCGQFFGLVFAKDILLNIPPIFTLATDAMTCFKFSMLVGLFALLLSNIVAIYQNGLCTHALGGFFLICGAFALIIKESGILIGNFYDPSMNINLIACTFFALTFLSWVLFPDPVFGTNKHTANVLWMLYSGPIGVAQDILSHMRLFGIALSGSILAMVINKICALMPPILGMLFAPIGHFTVFLLSLLSLYIHTNRLIFLEFGSKCMRGGHNYFEAFMRRS